MTCLLAGPNHTCDAACVWRNSLRPRPYRVVHAHFPQWRVFKGTVEREIEHDPTYESPRFIGVPTYVELPQVLVDDWMRVSRALEIDGYGNLGRIVSMLAILGARALCEQADRAAQG